ncbi:MAG: glycosyltransferase [Bryobacterales bacterium]|nr:glycosyltransferase [Bryobacterales bacterium]
MRILLAHNSLYYPSHGGGDKSNRLLMEALALKGHSCRVVARLGAVGPGEHERFLGELAARGVPPVSADSGVVVFRHGGVEVHVVTGHPNIRGYFAAQIGEFAPAVILTSTDDPAQLLLEAALRAHGPKVVFLARATLALPFGPDCAFPSPLKTGVLRRADGAVGVSRYVAGYLRRYGGLDAVHVPISLLEPGPYPDLGRFENEFVTLVNPCAVKGISIFLALADRMPEAAFAAVPTWGTNREDLESLKKRANVHILEPVDDIDRLLARTRVLLMPSLWAEARSRMIPEAMLRGVPVLAANVGGIPEAMLGVDYVLPVRLIERYRSQVDEQMVPVAEVPEQDIGPWQAALDQLLTDRHRYQRLSRLSRERALDYAASLSAGPFEEYLQEVLKTPRKPVSEEVPAASKSTLESLSPDKRRLLALRLHRRAVSPAGVEAWFPGAGSKPDARLRLFCFPYAGAGASAFRGWAEALPAGTLLCPVRPPGRESRLAEAPLREMDLLVSTLGKAIPPLLDLPFAFYGHSMGAAVGFELARRLRREGRPLPLALFVSGARAPRCRLGHVPPPEPSEEEFLAELERLEGLPEQVRRSPELMRVVLPALRADAALYRAYRYEEEPPLDCPVRAYGGAEDPNVRREHLELWAKETTGSFALRLIPGGHFFIETAREEFLAALAADLAGIAAAP